MATVRKKIQFTHSHVVDLPDTGDDWILDLEDGGRVDLTTVIVRVKNPASLKFIDKEIETVVPVSAVNYNKLTLLYDKYAVNMSESYKLESDLTP